MASVAQAAPSVPLNRKGWPEPYYSHGGIAIYLGDCREIMPSLVPVDAVITDEPYGIGGGAAFVRQGGAVVADCDTDGFNALCPGWVPMACALVTPGGYFASFTSRQRRHWLESEVALHGLTAWTPYYFVRPNPAPNPRPAFQSAVEECAVAYRGARWWYGGGATPNCWIGQSATRRGSGHPAEKPLGCMTRLVGALTPKLGTILDPFMGSGTTLLAALNLGRKAIGIEIEERYCEIAAKRLQQDCLPFDDVPEVAVNGSLFDAEEVLS